MLTKNEIKTLLGLARDFSLPALMMILIADRFGINLLADVTHQWLEIAQAGMAGLIIATGVCLAAAVFFTGLRLIGVPTMAQLFNRYGRRIKRLFKRITS